MKHAELTALSLLTGLFVAGSTCPASAQEQQPPASAAQPAGPGQELQERVAALNKSLAEDQARLKQYEWIETTVVSMDSEEASRKQNRCYYGAEGGVQKVPVTAEPPPEKTPGLRGKIKEKKSQELTDYMDRAVDMVKLYVPPKPEKIEAALKAGKVSFTPNQPGGRVRVDVRDYQKPGDTLSIAVDPKDNSVAEIEVKTYLADAKDAVGLKIRFQDLNDGTGYPANVVLDAKAKKVRVDVTNSGYRKTEEKAGG